MSKLNIEYRGFIIKEEYIDNYMYFLIYDKNNNFIKKIELYNPRRHGCLSDAKIEIDMIIKNNK